VSKRAGPRSSAGPPRAALRRESARALREQIRRLLARPMRERTHFLRVRVPGAGSAV
jgi:hypothetical protein